MVVVVVRFDHLALQLMLLPAEEPLLPTDSQKKTIKKPTTTDSKTTFKKPKVKTTWCNNYFCLGRSLFCLVTPIVIRKQTSLKTNKAILLAYHLPHRQPPSHHCHISIESHRHQEPATKATNYITTWCNNSCSWLRIFTHSLASGAEKKKKKSEAKKKKMKKKVKQQTELNLF